MLKFINDKRGGTMRKVVELNKGRVLGVILRAVGTCF